MNAVHSLELALFRQQRTQIRRSLVAPSRAFRAYERRYLERTRSMGRLVARRQVDEAVLSSDIVYVGDYHTLRQAQQTYLQLVTLALTEGRRPLALALEFVEGRHQLTLDAYLKGKLDDEGLRAALGHPLRGESGLWAGFLPILRFARAHRLEVVGIDRRAPGPRSLELRDGYAARRIAALLRRPRAPRVLVLIGQYHVVPEHLPAQVTEAMQGRSSLRSLVLYQNCEGVYWALARKGLHHQAEAVELRPGELCLLTASPVLCQQSFLDYLESESGELAGEEVGPELRFRELAALVAGFVGISVEEALEETDVITAANLEAMRRLQARGSLSRRELGALRSHVLTRQSYYVPRARTAYLASNGLNHIAEEATHFVRHCCVGAVMDAPRPPQDAFYARCLEEALGFFGSRLVHPRRTCPSLDDWAKTFRTAKRAIERQTAAFVLAHRAAERGGGEEARKLIPLRPDRLFNGVTHALGYLLGDGLHQAFHEGRVPHARVRALFRDPFTSPADAYFAVLEEIHAPL